MKTFRRMTKSMGVLLAIVTFAQVQAQNCYVIKDSVVAGSGVGRFTEYVYNAGRLAQAHYTDSGAVTGPGRSVIVLFQGINPVEYRITNNYSNPPALEREIVYTRDGNGRITSIFDSTDQATLSYTVSYNGSGQISSVILSSFTGSPDFPASFTDFTWLNGNITSLNLLVGGDTLELSVSTDNKNNVKSKLLPLDGAADVFQTATANNITNVTFVNDENVGGTSIPAGSYAIRQVYTYTGNDVQTLESLPSAFDDNTETTRFFYDCTIGLSKIEAKPVTIYPNPAKDIITLETGVFNGVVKFFDVTGKVIRTDQVENVTSLNISNLNSGIYYVEISDKNNAFRGKFLKN